MTLSSKRFSIDEILGKASERAGLSDFGDDFFREGLGIFIQALNQEARLNDIGAMIAENRMLGSLVNRLEMTDWIKRHPEILKEEIKQPIFIVGMGRTGTTILHDLLALDPAHRVPQTWEVSRPCPPPAAETYETDPRIAQEAARIEMTHKAAPELQTMHPNGAQLPQECGLMHCNDFASGSFGSMFRVPTYMEWYRNACDISKIYASQRRQLQLLQWRCKRERWVLKSPQHLANLDALVKEFPDALLIQTHRDPIKVVGSAASLIALLRKMAADDVDLTEPAREWLEYQTAVLDRSVDFREKSGFSSNQIADILFHEFIPDPIKTIRATYQKFGLKFSDQLGETMRQFIADHPSDKHGKHQYTFAGTGLKEADVREKTRRYMGYFGVKQDPA